MIDMVREQDCNRRPIAKRMECDTRAVCVSNLWQAHDRDCSWSPAARHNDGSGDLRTSRIVLQKQTQFLAVRYQQIRNWEVSPRGDN